MASSAEDLGQRVYAMIAVDRGPIEYAHEGWEQQSKTPLSAFELNIRDWSLMLGLAYAIARGEDPYAPDDATAEKAIEAARAAWNRFDPALATVKRYENAEAVSLMAMDDLRTDDVKLMEALLQGEGPELAWRLAEIAGVDGAYAEEVLARMADWTPVDGDPSYPVIRRSDLGPDVYEAIEDSAREGKRA